MGCTESTRLPVAPADDLAGITKRRTSTQTTTATLDNLDWLHSGGYGNVKRRSGHPMAFKTDGYRIIARISGKSPHYSSFLCESVQTHEQVIMKEFNLHAYQSSNHDDHTIQREIRLLSKVSHSMLPGIIEVFTTEGSTFVVTEFMHSCRLTSLLQPMDSDRVTALSPQSTHNIIKSLVCALQFLHEEDIVLRDLTPSNIMVNSLAKNKYELCVADMAAAVEAGSKESISLHPLFQDCAREENEPDEDDAEAMMDCADDIMYYQAPEFVYARTMATPAMDMWALGVLCYLLLSGRLPYSLKELSTLGKGGQVRAGLFVGSVWDGVGDRAKDFIKCCLQVAPEDRIASLKAIRHPFLLVGP